MNRFDYLDLICPDLPWLALLVSLPSVLQNDTQLLLLVSTLWLHKTESHWRGRGGSESVNKARGRTKQTLLFLFVSLKSLTLSLAPFLITYSNFLIDANAFHEALLFWFLEFSVFSLPALLCRDSGPPRDTIRNFFRVLRDFDSLKLIN